MQTKTILCEGMKASSRASSTHQQSFRDDLLRVTKDHQYQYIANSRRELKERRTGSFGMLTTDTNTPEVSETPVATDLLQPFEVITELRVDIVGQDLAVLAVDDIFVPVKEPEWNLELRGVLHDVHDSFELVRVQVTSADNVKEEERWRLH
jgi:hypothetical protein